MAKDSTEVEFPMCLLIRYYTFHRGSNPTGAGPRSILLLRTAVLRAVSVSLQVQWVDCTCNDTDMEESNSFGLSTSGDRFESVDDQLSPRAICGQKLKCSCLMMRSTEHDRGKYRLIKNPQRGIRVIMERK